MDSKSQEIFDELLAMDKDSLSLEQKQFLMARRGYFNDEDKKRYADIIKLHEAGKLTEEVEEDEDDLKTLSLAKLKKLATAEKVEVKGLKTVAEFARAIQAKRDEDAE